VRLTRVISARLIVLAVGVVASASAVRTQFRTGVEVVEVDVSVLDNRRRPVRGLTSADFTVLEDGRPQEIVSFAAIDVREPEVSQPGWTRDVAPDVRTNLAGAERLMVMVLDDAQVRVAPQHTKAVKEIARSVVDRLGPNDLAAVVFTRDNAAAQPFTNERQRLLAAIDRFHGEFSSSTALPGYGTPADRDQVNYFYLNPLLTLRYAAESLYDASQRRKSVIFVSPGVPLEGSDLDAFRRRQEVQRIVESARRANVNVYGLDPSGLGGLDREDVELGSGRTQRMANDLLHTLATETAGRAFVNRNEFGEAVRELFAENASYYLIGYRSTSTGRPGKFRNIDVRVDRPGVTVRARSGYAPRALEKPARSDGPSTALVNALRDSAPKGDVAMQMSAAPFAIPGKKNASVVMAIALRQPRITSEERVVEKIDLLIGAYGPDGKRGPFDRLKGQLVLKSTENPFIHYEVLTGLQMPPGRYQIRVAAQSALNAKEGSLHYDVTVPDFSKDEIDLSGVLLSAEPNVPVAGKDRIASTVPVVPTSRREFWPQDRVSAFARVYRKKDRTEPVTITARLQDVNQQAQFEQADSLGADRFTPARAADYHVTLPIDRLSPGAYLLTIDVRAGKAAARRQVRIVRR
jgi:VWFA-related protein